MFSGQSSDSKKYRDLGSLVHIVSSETEARLSCSKRGVSGVFHMAWVVLLGQTGNQLKSMPSLDNGRSRCGIASDSATTENDVSEHMK